MSDFTPLLTVLVNTGGLGILVAFLMWRDNRDAKIKAEHESERIRAEERRLSYDRERLEADKSLAASLAALTAVVQGARK